jgi:hypothetical protein
MDAKIEIMALASSEILRGSRMLQGCKITNRE